MFSLRGDELLTTSVLLCSAVSWLSHFLFLLVGLGTGASIVVLSEDLLVDLGEHALLEETKEVPSCVERLEDITTAILALLEEVSLELLKEDEEVFIVGCEGVLTDDSLHGQRILARSIETVHLGEN